MAKKALEAVLSLLLEALRVDAKAAKELLERGHGNVADKIEGGDLDTPTHFTHSP